MKKKLSKFFAFFSLFLAIIFIPIICISDDALPFADVALEESFEPTLMENHDIMTKPGAWIIKDQNETPALIGIGSVVVESDNKEPFQRLVHKGQMKARKHILEYVGDVEISVKRGGSSSGDKMSLSTFYHTTQTKIEGHIKALPVVGTWWSQDRNILFVAIGDQKKTSFKSKNIKTVANQDSLPEIKGKEPFVSLLKRYPHVMKNGGVRGFILEDGSKIIIAVASSDNQSPYKARRIAKLRAIKVLLEQNQGIAVSAIERLSDRETLFLSNNRSEYMSVSEFLSVQEERVSGFIKALPVVAEWKKSGRIHIAIGPFKKKN